MALMSLRNHYHVNVPMVLTREDHLLIHNYKRSLLNIMLRPILLVCRSMAKALTHTPYYLCVDALAN